MAGASTSWMAWWRWSADGRQRILPVWHNVTRADVAGYSPSLSGLLARSTSEFSVDEIAKEIADVARA
jgi:hypothetical protein